LFRYLNKTESVGLRKCPHYQYLTEKVMNNNKQLEELAHIRTKKQLA